MIQMMLLLLYMSPTTMVSTPAFLSSHHIIGFIVDYHTHIQAWLLQHHHHHHVASPNMMGCHDGKSRIADTRRPFFPVRGVSTLLVLAGQGGGSDVSSSSSSTIRSTRVGRDA